ncbi:O-antigen ligase family protein [Baekduia alba]|uniref:O-antigen ligase family protein n=1 Tax=Baekduia alba TaxID=2997333 RepID=UPI0023408CE0|nr:O-antigen ligase family protein [Baekduia alba]
MAATGAARRPTRGALLALGALGGLIGWVALSGSWSHAGWRGTLDVARELGALGTLAAFALLGRTDGRARTLLLGLAGAALVVQLAGLGAWLAPDHVHGLPSAARVRLSAPTTYWNATGTIAALGAVWCIALAAADPARAVRVAAAAAVAPAAATIYLTASRGAALAAAVGIAMLLATGPARRVLLALVPAGLGAGIAVLAARSVHGLDVAAPSGGALGDGHRAALVILAGAVVAAAARAAVLPLERRVDGWTPPSVSRTLRAGGAVAGLVVVLTAGVAVALHRADGEVSSGLAPSARFQEIGTNGRGDLWRVALREGARAHPLRGSGAGTFGRLWARDGTTHFDAVDAHSLYVETAAELGLVGLALLAVLLATLLVGLLRRAIAGPPAWAGLAAGATALLAHAGYDFDWEQTALMLPLFAAGGLALARPEEGRPAAPSPPAPALGPEAGATAAAPSPPTPALGPEARATAAALPLLARVGVVTLAAALALVPVAVHRSQRDLDAAFAAFRAGDCAATVRHAQDTRGALAQRPEPYALLAWCAAQRRDPKAITYSAQAIARDPGDWRLRFSDALVHARLGRDPRPAFAAALARSPGSLDLKHARPTLGRAHQPVWWRRGAAAVPWPEPRLAGQQLPARTG